MTTIEAFHASMTEPTPPAGLSPALQALWWSRKGDWGRAHRLVQQYEGDRDCDLVHAHLHRQEGDMANASGWYRRTGKPMPILELSEEWEVIATELLARG